MRKKIDLSPNFNKKNRKLNNIKFVIIHYTGMQSEIESLRRLKDPKSKVSTHYLINRKGLIIQMVRDNKIAWHAGKSKWLSYKNLNNYSIGIELVNRGHQYGYQKFPDNQIKSLINLCKNLKRKYKIVGRNFLGHSDIAPLRKIDPGEKFPWQKLSNYKLGEWYKFDRKISKKNKDKAKEFFKNLNKIGYRYFQINRRKKIKDNLIVKSFQRRYLPKKVSGIIDQKTLQISYFLAARKKIS